MGALWINKATTTIRRILYGWRILCCFGRCRASRACNKLYQWAHCELIKLLQPFTEFYMAGEYCVVFFPCFLILASGQFLNIVGWILFYATIHVYSVFFLLIFKLGHLNVSNINYVSLRNTVRFVFICKIFVISYLEFLFIGFAGSRRLDSLDFDWLKLMKVLLL